MTLMVTMYGPGFPHTGRKLKDTIGEVAETQSLLTEGLHVVELDAGGWLAFRGGDGCAFSFGVQEEAPPEVTRISVAKRVR